ncbi:hypothetical protein L596_012090 [Steinernema carpocapsae]|uniref:N-acetyltransferase domain-containing protein n=1 Tax=Steinernema carpocapsae TaxID=34508 RepID=A0A4U5NW29_STECR|nr:hypothetical protein L596_012090 [Steinernema carpocapsae]
MTVEETENNLENKVCAGFLALDGEKPVGMLLYFLAYSSWEGQYPFMEDLYVRPQYRRQKVGLRLWKELGKTAQKQNYPRIEWAVAKWNESAIKFYDVIKATNLTEEKGYMKFRITEEGIEKLVEDSELHVAF